MEEIKDGEYIRTIVGTITKIEDTEFDIKFKIPTGKPIYRNWKEDFGGSYVAHEDIVKHSSNIIDLIEVGDYVNGYLVSEVKISTFDSIIYIDDYKKELHENDIKSIVTKENFKSVSYEV